MKEQSDEEKGSTMIAITEKRLGRYPYLLMES